MIRNVMTINTRHFQLADPDPDHTAGTASASLKKDQGSIKSGYQKPSYTQMTAQDNNHHQASAGHVLDLIASKQTSDDAIVQRITND